MANTREEYAKYDRATMRAASGWTNIAKVLEDRKTKPAAEAEETPKRRSRPPREQAEAINDLVEE